jgi:hypothetical protein
MATANLDAADLKGALKGGLIREDVMDRIWDISKIPLPFTDMIGTEQCANPLKEWTLDKLATPDITNARIDGADAGTNNTVLGTRVGNHCQTSDKVVRVSYRASATNNIGRARELSYQLQRRQQELRRDVEAIMLVNQASIADDGSAVAGKSGGLPAWLKTNFQNGTVGGFNTTTGVVTARTPGVRAALTETWVRQATEQVFNQGGEASVFMSTPAVIRQFSSYLFTSSARIATLMSDIEGSAAKATAMGSVNVFVTDFGTLKFVPNRLQQTHLDSGSAACADAFVLDPGFLAIGYLQGYRTDELAKTGTAENRQMIVDWTLVVKNEASCAIIGDIDFSAAVTA